MMKKQLLISLLVVGLFGSWALFAIEGENSIETEYKAQEENQQKLEDAKAKLEAKEARDGQLDADEQKQLEEMEKVEKLNAKRLSDAEKLVDAARDMDKSRIERNSAHNQAVMKLGSIGNSFETVKQIIQEVEKKLSAIEDNSGDNDDQDSDTGELSQDPDLLEAEEQFDTDEHGPAVKDIFEQLHKPTKTGVSLLNAFWDLGLPRYLVVDVPEHATPEEAANAFEDMKDRVIEEFNSIVEDDSPGHSSDAETKKNIETLSAKGSIDKVLDKLFEVRELLKSRKNGLEVLNQIIEFRDPSGRELGDVEVAKADMLPVEIDELKMELNDASTSAERKEAIGKVLSNNEQFVKDFDQDISKVQKATDNTSRKLNKFFKGIFVEPFAQVYSFIGDTAGEKKFGTGLNNTLQDKKRLILKDLDQKSEGNVKEQVLSDRTRKRLEKIRKAMSDHEVSFVKRESDRLQELTEDLYSGAKTHDDVGSSIADIHQSINDYSDAVGKRINKSLSFKDIYDAVFMDDPLTTKQRQEKTVKKFLSKKAMPETYERRIAKKSYRETSPVTNALRDLGVDFSVDGRTITARWPGITAEERYNAVNRLEGMDLSRLSLEKNKAYNVLVANDIVTVVGDGADQKVEVNKAKLRDYTANISNAVRVLADKHPRLTKNLFNVSVTTGQSGGGGGDGGL